MGYSGEKALSQDWGTPWKHFFKFDAQFHFTLDVCARAWNRKVLDHWFSPDDDGLRQSWAKQTCWCNPPYDNIEAWLEKAERERRAGATTALLLPNATDTVWFHTYVWDEARLDWRPGVQMIPLRGRIKFDMPPELIGEVTDFGPKRGNILIVMRPLKRAQLRVTCPKCGARFHAGKELQA